MTIRTKVEPISDWIKLTVDQTLSPEARSEAVGKFARARLVEAQDANRRILGRLPPHTTAVDGRMGAEPETVDPDRGIIIFEFELVSDVLVWIARTLEERSPVISGDYRRGHTLFADGTEIPVGDRVPPADEYVFLNLVPYARKIEIGKTASGRDFVIQVPNRIYERTAKDAKARFGNIAKIRASFRAPISGNIIKYGGAASKHRKRGGVWSGGSEWSARVPAIIVTIG